MVDCLLCDFKKMTDQRKILSSPVWKSNGFIGITYRTLGKSCATPRPWGSAPSQLFNSYVQSPVQLGQEKVTTRISDENLIIPLVVLSRPSLYKITSYQGRGMGI